MRATRTHRADVADVGAESGHDRRDVELRVVRQHTDRVLGSEVGTVRGEPLIGPLHHHLIGHREALIGREGRACVTDRDVVPEHLRDFGERCGEVDGAEDDHPRRRREDVEKDLHVNASAFATLAVVADEAPAGAQRAERVTAHDGVERRMAETADGSSRRRASTCSCPHRRLHSQLVVVAIGQIRKGRPGSRRLAGRSGGRGRPARLGDLIALGDHGREHDRRASGERGFELLFHRWQARGDEDVDHATTGQTDGEGFVVGVAEPDEAGLAGFEHVERLEHDRAFDASPRDGAGHTAIRVDDHRGARSSGSRAIGSHDAGERNAVTVASPALNVCDYVLDDYPPRNSTFLA